MKASQATVSRQRRHIVDLVNELTFFINYLEEGIKKISELEQQTICAFLKTLTDHVILILGLADHILEGNELSRMKEYCRSLIDKLSKMRSRVPKTLNKDFLAELLASLKHMLTNLKF